MNTVYKEKWVAALRSGKYQQGRTRLCKLGEDGNRYYCCLGVLCEVISEVKQVVIFKPKPSAAPDKCYETFDKSTNYLSISLKNEVGLNNVEEKKLAAMNDEDENTFIEIAQYIEENL